MTAQLDHFVGQGVSAYNRSDKKIRLTMESGIILGGEVKEKLNIPTGIVKGNSFIAVGGTETEIWLALGTVTTPGQPPTNQHTLKFDKESVWILTPDADEKVYPGRDAN